MEIKLYENNKPAKDEILEMAKSAETIVIAGQDPLKRSGIAEIIKKLSNKEIWIRTDGHELVHMAQALKNAGLTGVEINVNSFNYTRYAKTHDGKELGTVITGINKATEQGLKIRIFIAIEKGFNDGEIMDLVQVILQHQYEIIFTEPVGITIDEIKSKMRRLKPVEPTCQGIELFKYPGSKGTIGFVINTN